MYVKSSVKRLAIRRVIHVTHAISVTLAVIFVIRAKIVIMHVKPNANYASLYVRNV